MITINLSPYDEESCVFEKAAKKLGVKKEDVRIVKKSIDARHKNDIKIIYNVGVKEEIRREYEKIHTNENVVIAGAGPAGLFCGLYLARHGIKPVIFERGDCVENRTKKVNEFLSGGSLDEECNVQFGEGGAGTFSDGKLNTGINNGLIGQVLQDFVSFGAPADILYLNKPHIGSDKLKQTVINLRKEIERLGGRFFFNTKIEDFRFHNGKIKSVIAGGKEYEATRLVLAIGHSARDTFKRLYELGFSMESKEFAVGLRVEQLQSVIDEDRYGKFRTLKTLPPSDYKLVSHASDRSVFTFCMCPGGVVIPAASERGGVVVNGMSNYLRDGKNANSAVIAQIRKSDFVSTDPLSGVDFQRMLERNAFLAGGSNYCAPVALCEDFINGNKPTSINGVYPTYSRGFTITTLDKIFPKDITESLKKGLMDMDQKIKGFASNGAVLSGVESRTSSPIRILRKENSESVSHGGVYPCGEGCGYAGGITSASVDGIKVAESIFNDLKQD